MCIRDSRRSISDIFRIHVVASSTPPTSPLITLSNTTFFHVRHGGLWLVAVCKHVGRALSLVPGGRVRVGEDRRARQSSAVHIALPSLPRSRSQTLTTCT